VKIGFVILYVLFYIKMLYRWFFFYCKFYDFNRIWFRYSRVRNSRKKGIFFASFISFCLGGFPVSRFFSNENVVVVGSKKVVKTDDIYLLLSLLQFVGDVGMKLVMHFHQSSNIFGVDSKSLLLQVGSSCQGGRDVRLDRLKAKERLMV